MSNKRDQKMLDESMQAFMSLLHTHGGIQAIFSGMFGHEPKETHPHDRLGDGYELQEIVMHDKKGDRVNNDSKYSHLYHNGLQVTDKIFRRGGIGGKFKDGYCSLIHYVQKEPHTEKKHGFDFGTHVIINQLGDIVLSGKGSLEYPHHIGGHLGSLGNYIYDLRTGEAIMPKPSSSYISGKNCIVIEHRYDWYDKEVKMPVGIYRIEYDTVKITKIDDVKK